LLPPSGCEASFSERSLGKSAHCYRENSSRLEKIFWDLLRNSFLGALLTGSGGGRAAGIFVFCAGGRLGSCPSQLGGNYGNCQIPFLDIRAISVIRSQKFGCGRAALGNPRLA